MEGLLSNWIANVAMIARNTPFSFEGRKWAPALIDTKSRRRVFKMSRQVGKSVTQAAEMVSRCTLIENFVALHVSPSQKQSRKFSQDKVQPLIIESPLLLRNMGDYNNVHERTFRRNGKLYMEYASDNPDRCRGITADFVAYDEVQDQRLDLIENVINNSMFTSPYKMVMYAGTPKSLDNGIEANLWQNSDQREYLIRCRHHSPIKWIKLGYKNLGKKGPICHLCGNLLDVDDGQWAVTNPEGKFAGFHVNQLQCKTSHNRIEDWNVILEQFEEVPFATFQNEVLGESHDSAEVPMPLSMLEAACDPSIRIDEIPEDGFYSTRRFAGIDWGHGKAATVLTIGQFHPRKDRVFRYVFMKKYEGKETHPDFCIPDMVRIMQMYKVSRAHVDYGGGFGLWPELAKRFGKDRVTTNYYADNAKAADNRWNTKDHDIPMLTINRSKAVSAYVNRVKKGRIQFFNWGHFHPEFTSDFTAVRKEVDNSGNVRYIRVGCDDGFHSALYCFIVAHQADAFI